MASHESAVQAEQTFNPKHGLSRPQLLNLIISSLFLFVSVALSLAISVAAISLQGGIPSYGLNVSSIVFASLVFLGLFMSLFFVRRKVP